MKNKIGNVVLTVLGACSSVLVPGACSLMLALGACSSVLALGACSSAQEQNPTKREAIEHYVLVSDCDRWYRCDQAGLLAAHPGGVQGCVEDDLAQVTRILGEDAMSREGTCARAELRRCATSFAQTACQVTGAAYSPYATDRVCADCGWP